MVKKDSDGPQPQPQPIAASPQPSAAPPQPQPQPQQNGAAGTQDVERHYDSQAGHHRSRAEALAARRSGPLYAYKRYANAVKRRMIKEHAGGPGATLVDLGCGRGGDLGKWREARLRRVLALDLSAAQLDEAREREARDPARGARCVIDWRHGSMLAPGLAAALRPELPPEGADGVALQFAVQYGFGNEAAASALLGEAAALLRPGGVFFGVAPDGDAIEAQLRERGVAGSAGRELSVGPPEIPFSLLLRAVGDGWGGSAGGGGGEGAEGGGGAGGEGARAPDFGAELLFSLGDTVTAGSESDGCTEYLLRPAVLRRLAGEHGLRVVELGPMLPEPAPPDAGSLSEAERMVARLYFAFAFRKEAV